MKKQMLKIQLNICTYCKDYWKSLTKFPAVDCPRCRRRTGLKTFEKDINLNVD